VRRFFDALFFFVQMGRTSITEAPVGISVSGYGFGQVYLREHAANAAARRILDIVDGRSDDASVGLE
jgi:hypothetical protein